MAVIKVKSTHPESQGAFVLIEEETFDKSVHKLYVEGEVEVEVVKEVKEVKETVVEEKPTTRPYNKSGDK